MQSVHFSELSIHRMGGWDIYLLFPIPHLVRVVLRANTSFPILDSAYM